MTWQNPWALAGLVAVAVPILVHLLSRRNARVERFPTLRFLPISPSAPVRRTRLTDPLLMLLRAAIVATAAAALAQPLFRSADRVAQAEGRVTRAIVVDTSVSMRRAAATAIQGIDSARRVAAASAATAAISTVIETSEPARVIPGAASWLRTQSGRRELVVISDFQRGTIDSLDLAVAREIATVRLEQIPVAGPVSLPVAPGIHGAGISLLTTESSRAAAHAALRAAAPAAFDTATFSLAVVYPDSPQRASLLAAATPIARAKYADAVVRIDRDALLRSALLVGDISAAPEAPVLTRFGAPNGNAAAIAAAEGQLDGRAALLLFPGFAPGEVASAALISAAARAVAPHAAPPEQDTELVAADVLRRWSAAGGVEPVIAAGPSGESDGKWFWLVVIALLAVETVMRKRPSDPAVPETADAR